MEVLFIERHDPKQPIFNIIYFAFFFSAAKPLKLGKSVISGARLRNYEVYVATETHLSIRASECLARVLMHRSSY